jgi:hypothetical protein
VHGEEFSAGISSKKYALELPAINDDATAVLYVFSRQRRPKKEKRWAVE